MDEKKKQKPKKKRVQTDKTVHVGFGQEDHAALTEQAKSVGMSLTSYVRQQALTGKVKGYDLQPLTDHAIVLGNLAVDIRSMIREPHVERWKYEADIERIETLLTDLLREEKALHETMMRRLNR